MMGICGRPTPVRAVPVAMVRSTAFPRCAPQSPAPSQSYAREAAVPLVSVISFFV